MANAKTINGVTIDVPAHAASITAHAPELLATLFRGINYLQISTNAGWTTDNTGSGGLDYNPTYLRIYTGITASSRGMGYSCFRGFNVAAGNFNSSTNWDKKLYFMVLFGRMNSDAQVVSRLQLKTINTAGALGGKGIGIRADNYVLTGESYGTELGTVDLGVTLTDLREKLIVIIHDPSVPKIEWWIDEVLAGTQSTAAKIPSGGTNDSYIVASIINGVGGGVNAITDIFQPRVIQVR